MSADSWFWDYGLMDAENGLWGTGITLVPTPEQPQQQAGPRLDDVKASGSQFGVPIADVRGSARVQGNIIWAADIKEVRKWREVHLDGPDNDYYTAYYEYYGSFAVALGRGPLLGIRRIWADSELIYSVADGTTEAERRGNSKLTNVMEFYAGTESQLADPTIVAHEGAANVPAFRGMSYVVFTDLPLKDYGNRLPQLSFEVVADGSISGGLITRASHDAGTMLDGICQSAGLEATEVDVSGVSAAVRGMLVMDGKYADALTPVLKVFSIDAFQSGAQLVFRQMTAADTVEVDFDDLGWSGSDSLSVTRVQESELPRQVSVNYFDFDRDHLKGSQPAQRQAGRARSETKLETTLAMTASDAVQAAERSLYAAWVARLRFTLKLPPKYLGIEPGDIIRITVPGVGLLSIRSTKVTIGANLAVEVEGESWSDSVLSSTAEGESGVIPNTEVRASGDTILRVLDIPALGSGYDGPYLWVAATGDSPWRSAALHKSADGGATYTAAMGVPAYSIMGETVGTLAAGSTTVWDTANTVDVDIYRGELESRTDAAVLAGDNLLLIGDEIIQFATAELIAPGRYRLSRLLRGRRGSEWAMGLHGAGERVVLLATALPLAMSLAELGATRYWRAPSQDQQLEDVDATSAVFQGYALKPLSPVHVKGVRAGGDLTVTWVRRSRIGQELPPGGGDIALGEASERYEVEVMDGATPVRSIIVTTPSWTYTAAMQAADFGTAPSFVEVNIFQLSETVGRGRAATATL